MKISDAEILSICIDEIENAAGGISGDLADERTEALDRYYGEPYGDEVEGRSGVRTREVYETVEGILPSLVRIFAESDNMVTFNPTGPEDEEQAEQESDAVNYYFWNRNRGFYNVYTFLKDALLSKTGILKVWADVEDKEEREEYEGLDDMQLGELLNDPAYEREVIEWDIDENGYSVVFKTKSKRVDINVEPVPPEEFGVSGTARSPYAKDAQFVWQRALKSYGDLVAEGYDKATLERIESSDGIGSTERQARRNLTDEYDYFNSASELSMRQFWITECYLHIDRDGDGIPELIKATIAAGETSNGSGEILDVEEVDRIPFVSASPVLLTHKFHGMSIADLVVDLQQINTTLLRQVIDNTYLANNGQTAANTDFVNIDDLMTRRPGGVVRYEGQQPWNSVVGPIPHNQLPPQTFELFERLDERQKRRTGFGDEVAGLDSQSLASVNTGVAAMAYEAAHMKIELIARIVAEIGFKPLFHDIHELLMKHQDRELMLKLRGQWVPMNPSEWKTRENSTVQVGIGLVSRERRIMGYEAVMQKQQELVASGAMGTLVMPEMIYESHKKWTKAWGFEPSLYFQDPRQLPPPQPQQPGAQEQLMMAQAEALKMDGQSKLQRNQIDAQKLQLEAAKAQSERQFREAEVLLKTQIERLKSDLNNAKTQVDVTGKVASLEAAKDKEDTENRLKVAQMRLDQLNAEKDRELTAYKMQSDHYVKLLELHNLNYSPEQYAEQAAERESKAHEEQEKSANNERLMGELYANLVQITEKLGAMEASSKAPKPVKRDAKGLIIQIGGQPVMRDESGQVTQIG